MNIDCPIDYLNTDDVSQIQKEAKTVTKMRLTMSLARLLVKVILVWLSDSKSYVENDLIISEVMFNVEIF